MRRGRENQSAPKRLERADPIWARSSDFHTGPRRVNCRIMRPDTRKRLTTCPIPKEKHLHSPGRPHTMHEFDAGDRLCGMAEILEAEHRSEPKLDGSVILFDPIIQIF